MKPLFSLFAAAVLFALPFSASAAPAPSVDGGRSGKWLRHTEVIGQGKNRATYYYTNVVLTGTHVPVVIRRFHGHLEIVSGGMLQGVAYSVGDLGNTGANDVSSELAGLDPSISIGGHR